MIETKNYQPQLPDESRDKFQEATFKFVGWFSKDFWPKYKNYVNIAMFAIIVVLAYAYYQKVQANAQIPIDAKLQAPAFIAASQGNIDAEHKALETVLSKSETPSIRAQAALRLANLSYAQRKYPEAEKLFQKALADGADIPLIQVGAQHGLAALSMQKGNYSEAATKWESFIAQWGKRKAGVIPQGENEDISPVVPDALWQLSLCYKELGQKDKAKANLQKIISLYGDSQNGYYAGLAQQLLTSL